MLFIHLCGFSVKRRAQGTCSQGSETIRRGEKAELKNEKYAHHIEKGRVNDAMEVKEKEEGGPKT